MKIRKPIKPKEILIDQKMNILWNNGEQSSYDFWTLRTSCPCASCTNELTGEKTLDERSVDKNIRPISSQYVGNYALRIQWSDGHNTGIYTFESLKNKDQ